MEISLFILVHTRLTHTKRVAGGNGSSLFTAKVGQGFPGDCSPTTFDRH
jgi:hypothetical protein